MKKNLSLVQLTSLPDTLNVSEMMNVLGGSGIDDSISKCLIISIAVKCSVGTSATVSCHPGTAVATCKSESPAVMCSGTSALMCSGTPAISCAPNVSAVTCKGGGALKNKLRI